MTRTRLLLAVPIALATLLTACGDDDTTGSAASTSSIVASTEDAEEPADEATITERAVEAANAFTATLDAGQRSALERPFDHEAMSSGWHYQPLALAERAGISIGSLDAGQRDAAFALAESVLSEDGLSVLHHVIRAQGALDRAVETASSLPEATTVLMGVAADKGMHLYSAEHFFLALYGEPSTESAWAFQVSGHHWARTFVFVDGTVTSTPAVVGTDPDFEGADVRAKAAIDERVQAIYAAVQGLTAEQDGRARLDADIPEVVLAPGNDELPSVTGVSFVELSSTQQDAVRAAIDGWLSDVAPDIAEPLRERYRRELDQVTVSYAGSTDPTTAGAYVRIQGPSLWIEVAARPDNVDVGRTHHHVLYRDATDLGAIG